MANYFDIPSVFYMVTADLLIKAFKEANCTVTVSTAKAEAILLESLRGDKDYIEISDYVKASRVGYKVPLNRKQRVIIARSVNRQIEHQIENYCIDTYGEC